MACDRTNEVQAYYDGEMEPRRMSEFERHLRACVECLRELESLKRLSAVVGQMEIPRLGAEAIERMKQRVREAAERGVLRLAEWLTAAAAAVLLVGVMNMPSGTIQHHPSQVQVSTVSDTRWQDLALGKTDSEMATADLVSADPMDVSTWLKPDGAQGK